MTEQQKIAGVFIIGVLALAYLMRRSTRTIAPVTTTNENNDFYAPYYTTNPGIPDNTETLNGGDNVFNIYLDNPALSHISQQYIPIFGLVGMTAVGA